ncbi:MAG: CBS domain-containing protein [Alphaproteobacteria bacterium]|nr:CBS domain-containing protein [Alphaproteobacteria bacterium]
MIVQDILDRNGGRVIALSHDANIAELVATMACENIGSVMLTDQAGRLTGIVSERDLVRSLAENGTVVGAITAQELMTNEVIECRPDVSVEAALGLMSANEIRHLPIVDGGRLLGLVSIRDILDLQRELLVADVERRQQEAENLRQAHELLEERILERTDDLRQAVAIAENASKVKSAFLANASHELRTPLNAVIGFSEIISSQALGPIENPKYVEYSEDILTAGRHLHSLINDLLDLSKIESGKEELLEVEVIVPLAIRSMMVLVRERAAKENIELCYEPVLDGDALWADERKVNQILANLLSNAVKFTEPGGKVTVRAWSDPKTGYVIQVADTGIGIAHQDIPKALKPFSRIDSELSRKYEGTGLGLPLTKSFVEMHGGYLDLQSEENVGTTVTVRFPANRVRAVSAKAAKTA